ncbi:hypothetical protein PAXRUDRAFT_15917 [Paxillus rubicundulus Ve08.2h10]|uniref:Uncharacterized protein n=1 Tax=Paxillus rubicundulus Ve08.2h10 TaxID=930991 RepID=A0A0D0CBI6_9AGAM|nr:hypothetical protein PAXRUDRAFT_15917 [Paxillus rubicundulus Ve08.2h10]
MFNFHIKFESLIKNDMRPSSQAPSVIGSNNDNDENRDRLQSLQRPRTSSKTAVAKMLGVSSLHNEQSANTDDVFKSGLLTPPSSQTAGDDDNTPPHRASKSYRMTPVGPHKPPYYRLIYSNSQTSMTSPGCSASAQVAKRKRNCTSSSASTSTKDAMSIISKSTSNGTIVFATELSTPNPKSRKQSRRQFSVQTGSAGSSHINPRLSPTPHLRSLSPKKTSSTCICRSPAKHILYNSSHAANFRADYIPPDECPSRKCRMRARSTTPAYEPPHERFTPPREVEVTPSALDTPRAPISSMYMTPLRAKRTCRDGVKREPPEINLSRALRPPSPTDDPLLLSDGQRSTQSPPVRTRVTPALSSSPSDPQFDDPSRSFAAWLSGGRVNDFGSTHSVDTLPVFDVAHPIDETDDGWSDSEDEFNLTGEYTGKFTMLTVPTKADPPTSEARERMEAWGRPVSPFPYSEILERSFAPSDFTEEEAIAALDDLDTSLDDHWLPPFDGPEFGELATSPPPSNGSRSCSSDFPEPVLLQEEEAKVTEEEAEVDRALSVVDDSLNIPVSLQEATFPMRADEAEEDSSSDDGEDVEGDVVKVTSSDAVTAARAAAILRMHDYDCILAATGLKRSSRSVNSSTRKPRTTIGNAGITKPYSFEKSTSPPPSISALSEEWTREDWKRMDKCLVAERLAVGAASGRDFLADIQDVSKDVILERFMAQVGGDSVLLDLGPEWSRENLMMRLDILIKKQMRLSTKSLALHRKEPTTPLDWTVPRYCHRLKETFAVSLTADLLNTLVSTPLDPNLSFNEQDLRNRSLPEPLPFLELGRSSQRRDPILTPFRPPEPRPQHPKDQVHLKHAPLPKQSLIPVLIRPKRLVNLRHLSPSKPSRVGSLKILPPRRSSGCSVKELVKHFEESEDLVDK